MEDVDECEGKQRYKSVVAESRGLPNHPTAAARALHRGACTFAETDLSTTELSYEATYPATNLNDMPRIDVLVAAVSSAAVLFGQQVC